MAANEIVNKILDQNKNLSATHTPIPYLSEIPALGVDMPHTLILTCADPRLATEKFLDLSPGVQPITIRNVCGHVAPALDSILGLDGLVTLKEILIIHHTDCGALAFTDDKIRDGLKKRVPEMSNEIDSMNFGSITDVEQSVKDDLAVLKASPLIRKELGDQSFGFVFDLKTGILSPVKA